MKKKGLNAVVKLVEGNKKIQTGIEKILKGYVDVSKGCQDIKERVKGYEVR